MKKFALIFWRSVWRFLDIAGADHAAAFAFYAFFSLFPLILLLVSVSSAFIEPARVTEAIMEAMEPVLPLGEKHREVVYGMIGTVVAQGGKAGVLGFVGLVWAGLRFFKSLVHSQNVAWGCRDVPWWGKPVKSSLLLLTLASAIILGVFLPVVLQTGARIVPGESVVERRLLGLAHTLLPGVLVFYGLLIFYKLSPQTKVRWADVWFPALLAAACLVFSRQLLVVAIDVLIEQVSVVYQTIAVFIALLYGIYLSGIIIIYGSCLAAAIGRVGYREEELPEVHADDR